MCTYTHETTAATSGDEVTAAPSTQERLGAGLIRRGGELV
jgi:hypothetical protein